MGDQLTLLLVLSTMWGLSSKVAEVYYMCSTLDYILLEYSQRPISYAQQVHLCICLKEEKSATMLPCQDFQSDTLEYGAN